MTSVKTNQRMPEHSVAVLNRLFAALEYSLARYLAYARPWVRRPFLLMEAVARRLNDEHGAFAAEIAQHIDSRRGKLRRGQFAMDFTYYNDLSLEYLAPRLLDDQRKLILLAEQCAGELAHDPEACRFAKDVVRSLRKYAALLEELIDPRQAHESVGKRGRDTVLPGKVPSSPARNLRQRPSMEPQSAA